MVATIGMVIIIMAAIINGGCYNRNGNNIVADIINSGCYNRNGNNSGGYNK